MVSFLKNDSNKSYLIKNIMKKTFEKDFSLNPINAMLLSLTGCAGIFLYYWFVMKPLMLGFNPEELIMLIAYPLLVTATVLAAGKWESILKINFVAIIGLFLWKGVPSLYFTVPVAAGSIISPMFQLTKEWERAVLLRFGKFRKLKGPGLFVIFPLIDSVNKIVDLRIRATDFAAETTLTHDSVPITVDAIAFWMIWDGEKAVLEVENYTDAVILSAQTALRDSIGKNSLSTLLERREELGEEVRAQVDRKTAEWGITIQSIEIRDIVIPQQLENALSKKAQAEREKESRIILGDAEIELARKFMEAAKLYKDNETALKLRGMNIMFEGLKAGNSMLMVPSHMPDDLQAGNLFGAKALEEIAKMKNKEKKDDNS